MTRARDAACRTTISASGAELSGAASDAESGTIQDKVKAIGARHGKSAGEVAIA